MRVLVNVALAVPLLSAVYIVFLLLLRLQYPTEVWNEELVTAQPIHPGQVIEVKFLVERRRSCVLGISRTMEREDDKREFELGFLTQVIDADTPLFPRHSGYRITVPAELTTGTYKLFSRYRYYCTGLDIWSPWVRRTKPIPVEVVSP